MVEKRTAALRHKGVGHLCGLFMPGGWRIRKTGFVGRRFAAQAVMMSSILCVGDGTRSAGLRTEIDACGYEVNLR